MFKASPYDFISKLPLKMYKPHYELEYPPSSCVTHWPFFLSSPKTGDNLLKDFFRSLEEVLFLSSL